jgi:hypothetical protein
VALGKHADVRHGPERPYLIRDRVAQDSRKVPHPSVIIDMVHTAGVEWQHSRIRALEHAHILSFPRAH